MTRRPSQPQHTPSARRAAMVSHALALLLIGAVGWQAVTRRHAADAPVVETSLGLSVDINRDSVPRFTLLPGIGEAMALRIVADRDTNGPFKSIDNLDRVPGIGSRTIQRIRKYLSAVEEVDRSPEFAAMDDLQNDSSIVED